ncbi:MAG: hypothetical protein A2927_01000 [Candidatus Komeilibacteria bacterium RIFCSPLOWO2_01_FULL_45_10]|uniref:DUF1573 domain-containing protein n=1 Tax=Candidatus Komeilibacteria bacterium RIFCSPLOWO2_01_FULL_45_10 TaxID=1798550 RepID=A0A1G2BKZ2_9BACT|nr:MAG: hypothetical protein A2927_01000 [Candidatus Komeilibacteria bacterium RIFCSPLOWO2_01_FULL_45_10]
MKNASKNSTWFILGFISLLVIVGLYLIFTNSSSSQNNQDNQSVNGQLTAEEASFNFGTIAMPGGNVSHVFRLKNQGEGAVTVNRVSTSCMCTTAYLTTADQKRFGPYGMSGHSGLAKGQVTINPGEELVVEAIFDPAAHGPAGVGLISRSVYLETNSSLSPKVELKFTANVTN